MSTTLQDRASRHAALGDPARLAIVDELILSDRSPVELRRSTGLESNLLAHHLDVLETAGMIQRTLSSGDRRRRYVRLLRPSLLDLAPGTRISPGEALFICTRNSARSQLAAALWSRLSGCSGVSAGTRPADRVHPGAIAAARRAGLDLTGTVPRMITDVDSLPDLVITVCDQAHEELVPGDHWLHWSVPDPLVGGSRAGFDATVLELRGRITGLLGDTAAAA